MCVGLLMIFAWGKDLGVALPLLFFLSLSLFPSLFVSLFFPIHQVILICGLHWGSMVLTEWFLASDLGRGTSYKETIVKKKPPHKGLGNVKAKSVIFLGLPGSWHLDTAPPLAGKLVQSGVLDQGLRLRELAACPAHPSWALLTSPPQPCLILCGLLFLSAVRILHGIASVFNDQTAIPTHSH